MDEEDERFFFLLFFFFCGLGWVGLVGGSILALIRFCSLGTYYLCVFVFSFGLFGRGLLYLIDLLERLAPIFRN